MGTPDDENLQVVYVKLPIAVDKPSHGAVAVVRSPGKKKAFSVNQEASPWTRARIVHERYQGTTWVVQVEVLNKLGNGSHHLVEVWQDELERWRNPRIVRLNAGPSEAVHDLCSLLHLHEPNVVQCLRDRFARDLIYTQSGPVLIAINPCKQLKEDGFYNAQAFVREAQARKERDWAQQKQPSIIPHVFNTAQEVYDRMFVDQDWYRNQRNQTILVSGESGAGKTETTKYIMQYFASIGSEVASSGIKQQVLESNHILESFGNARTAKNDNSSRFGKFLKMSFNCKRNLSGTRIETYLLEKVRIVKQNPGERNFHIFYELLAGASGMQKEKWFLEDPTKYRYVNQSGCLERRDGISDRDTYQRTLQAMNALGFTSSEQDNILKLVAAILNIGNISFFEKESITNSQVIIDTSTVTFFERASKLLSITHQTLVQTLTTKGLNVGGEVVTTTLSNQQAVNARDALARAIYDRLFTWIVHRVNDVIAVKEESGHGPYVGVLDIFGFEHFETNSFEQLCINYANECLQSEFNETVLIREQKLYEREGVPWEFISFPDNSKCLQLFDGRPVGIFALLDEECLVPRGHDGGFARKLYDKCLDHENFSASYMNQACRSFVVHHYAGGVEYSTESFCEKNRDRLHDEIIHATKSSTNLFVVDLFHETVESSLHVRHRSASITSIGLGSQFRRQMSDLMDEIRSTETQFIRCLKPNESNRSNEFSDAKVSLQLLYSGVLEALRIARSGFPVRMDYPSFLSRYSFFTCKEKGEGKWDDQRSGSSTTEGQNRQMAAADAVVRQIISLQTDHRWMRSRRKNGSIITTSVPLIDFGFQLGRTIVFCQHESYELLESFRNKHRSALVVCIQACVRRCLAQVRYRKLYGAILNVQAMYRGRLVRRMYVQLRDQHRRAVLMQRTMRRWWKKQEWLKMQQICSANRIQAWWRCFSQRSKFKLLRSRIVQIQSWTRCLNARSIFRAKKREKRDVDFNRLEILRLQNQLRDFKSRAVEAELRAARAELELANHKQSKIMSNENSKQKSVSKQLQACEHILTSNMEARQFNNFCAGEKIKKIQHSQRHVIVLNGSDGLRKLNTSSEKISNEHYAKVLPAISSAASYARDILEDIPGPGSFELENEEPSSEDVPIVSLTDNKFSLVDAICCGNFIAVHEHLSTMSSLITTAHYTAVHGSLVHAATNVEMIQLLLQHGFHPDIVDESGRTLLLKAAERGDVELSTILIQYRADVSLRTPDRGANALHIAVEQGHSDLVSLFCRPDILSQYSFDVADAHGNTPVHYAAASAHPQASHIGELLLSLDFSPNRRNIWGETPLHLCCACHEDDLLVETLLRFGAKPDWQSTERRETPLHLAVDRGNERIATCLVLGGASMNLPDVKGVIVVESVLGRKLIKHIRSPPIFIAKEWISSCMACQKTFGLIHRSTHCRRCGRIFCKPCCEVQVSARFTTRLCRECLQWHR